VSPRRGDRVTVPPQQDQWDVRFGTSEAADGWEELAAMPCPTPGDAWRPSAPTRGPGQDTTASTGSEATWPPTGTTP